MSEEKLPDSKYVIEMLIKYGNKYDGGMMIYGV